ncbi:MAG: hypothetical protein R3C05_13000 [Pirellulaceae bacterium]
MVSHPVTVDATGCGTVHATKDLYLDDHGLRSEPAVASAQLTSRIDRINHPWRIVRRIAMKKANEQKGASDREGSRRLEKRVSENFDRQVAETSPLGDGSNSSLKNLVNVLRRFGIEEPGRIWASDTRYMLISALQREATDLAAPTPAPHVAGSHDVVIQFHESVVNNVATALLAGRTLTGPQLEQIAKSLFPNIDLEPKPQRRSAQEGSKSGGAESDDDTDEADDEETEPAKISFARDRPIIFDAQDGAIWIGINGTRFQQGESSLKTALRVRAKYVPVYVDGQGYILKREGLVDIKFPGSVKVSVGQITIRSKMEKVFGRAFPERLLERPLNLPIKQLNNPRVFVQAIDARHGWLTVGLD